MAIDYLAVVGSDFVWGKDGRDPPAPRDAWAAPTAADGLERHRMFNLRGVSGAELAEQQIIHWLVQQQVGEQQDQRQPTDAVGQGQGSSPTTDMATGSRPSGAASSSDWMPSGQERPSYTPELDYLAELGEAEGKDRQVLRYLSAEVRRE